MASYACVNRRGVKWYRKVALELITGMAKVNACVIFKELTKSKITRTSFRREVCKSLLGIETQTRLTPTKPMIHILQPRTGGGTSDRKQCVLCYENLTKFKKLSRDEARKRVKKSKHFAMDVQKSQQCVLSVTLQNINNNLFNVLMTFFVF